MGSVMHGRVLVAAAKSSRLVSSYDVFGYISDFSQPSSNSFICQATVEGALSISSPIRTDFEPDTLFSALVFIEGFFISQKLFLLDNSPYLSRMVAYSNALDSKLKASNSF